MANCAAVWATLLLNLRTTISRHMLLRYEIISGRSDCNTDDPVREIGASLRPLYVLFLWPFLLTPLSWAVLVVVMSIG